MLTEICKYLRNWFETARIVSAFKINSDGILTFLDGRPVPLAVGQYYRIVGSVFNDGVHECGNEDLRPEEFNGAVWPMAVPRSVCSLAMEIDGWTAANADAIKSPYQSESFGGYSYSMRGDSSGGGVSWQSQFSARLAPWRKI